MYMARSTWTQVRDYFKKHDLVIIGVGSTECHGTIRWAPIPWLQTESLSCWNSATEHI